MSEEQRQTVELVNLSGQPPNNQTNYNSPQSNYKETQRRIGQRKRARHNRRYGKSVSHQRAGIVHQAFSFQDCNDPAGDVQPFGDAGSRNCVRRRDDRPQNKPSRERQAWNEIVREQSDENRGK